MRLLKPSRLDRLGRRNSVRLQKARLKRLEAEKERFLWQIVRVAVYNRDGRKCRVCGLPLKLSAKDQFSVGHVHHLTFRSAGGSDELTNLVLLDIRCHDAAHRGALRLDGTAGRLRITWLPQ